ncbi:MAG: membrane protein insertase YidC [Acidiferrobacterales bacterium]
MDVVIRGTRVGTIRFPKHPIVAKSLTMDNRRFFLWTALAAILIMLWTSWQQEYGPKEPPKPIAETQVDHTVPTTPSVPTAETEKPATATIEAPSAKTVQLKSGKKIRVLTDLLEVEIDTYGGDIRSAKLRTYPVALHKTDEPFQLLNDDSKTLYVAQSGLIGKGGEYPNHKTLYRASNTRYELKQGEKELQVVLTWRAPNGVVYDKIFKFKRDSYVIDVSYQVHNKTNKTWQGYFYGQLQRIPPPEQTGLFRLPTYSGGAIYTPDDKYEKISYSDMEKNNLARKTTGGWAAILQHYFVVSWMDPPKQAGELYTRHLDDNHYVIGLKQTTPVTVQAGQTGTAGMELFVGPKEHNRLQTLVEGMNKTVDFGKLTFIASPLFWLLRNIEHLVGNWGWSIILLTMLLKLVFYPLNNASYQSMAKMRRLAPKQAALKERYKDDKQRYNQAIMEMYKAEKLNPMAGCLPMFIQIPVFIALYWVLLESVEMRQAPFILWIHDLSAPDPYFVLPVLMGISMFATTWLTPSTDPTQRKIFMAMPVVMTVFFLFFPAGLVLYWFVNNVLQFIQQLHITRRIEAANK